MINTSPWVNFGQTLMRDFQTQYGNNSQVLNFLRDSLMPIIKLGGRGFGNEALTAMRTAATDTTAQQYQNAQKALQNQQAQNGDPNLPSGVAEQQKEQLAEGGARFDANAQNQITLANEQQKENDFWNATQGLMGVAQGYNPLGYAGAANQAGQTAADIETANAKMMEAQGGGFMGSLKRGLGAGLSKFLTGGFSNLGTVLSGGGIFDTKGAYGGGN